MAVMAQGQGHWKGAGHIVSAVGKLKEMNGATGIAF